MTDKTKRKITETIHYKLVRISYLDFGYVNRRRYIHYNIVDKTTKMNVGMFSNLKLARQRLQEMENDKTND